MKWNHFIQNKVNNALGLPEKTTAESLQDYYNEQAAVNCDARRDKTAREVAVSGGHCRIHLRWNVSLFKVRC